MLIYRVAGVVMTVMLLAACSADDRAGEAAVAPVVDAAFVADTDAWRQQRWNELVQADGWASLVGLHPIELKAHYIGSGPGSGMRLAAGPARMGMVSRPDGRVFFTPESDAVLTIDGAPLKGRIEFLDDRADQPTVIEFDDGNGKLTLLARGGRHFLRLRHADAPARAQLGVLEYWPADPAWRIEARFVPHPAGTTVPVTDMLGFTTAVPSPGAVEFDRDGVGYRLDTLAQSDGSLQIVMADGTSGHGSYAAGRFLDVAAPVDGKVVLDFNRAYNPPSVFTTYATCPLPPAQNRLMLAIEAGEKSYRPRTPNP
jgi:uncharacterized protein (DUF1684 family)